MIIALYFVLALINFYLAVEKNDKVSWILGFLCLSVAVMSCYL